MKIGFHLEAEERERVISAILKNSKDPLHFLSAVMELYILLKGTSKVKTTGGWCLKGGRCNSVYHLCVCATRRMYKVFAFVD